MANTTKLLRCGTGESIPIDTEVTSTGVYPVEAKGVKAYVDNADDVVKAYADTEIAKPKDVLYLNANDTVYAVTVNADGELTCTEYTPPEP